VGTEIILGFALLINRSCFRIWAVNFRTSIKRPTVLASGPVPCRGVEDPLKLTKKAERKDQGFCKSVSVVECVKDEGLDGFKKQSSAN